MVVSDFLLQFFNLGTRWKLVVSFTPRPRHPATRPVWGWVCPRICPSLIIIIIITTYLLAYLLT